MKKWEEKIVLSLLAKVKKKYITPGLLIEVVIYSLSLGVGYNEYHFTDQYKSKKLSLFS